MDGELAASRQQEEGAEEERFDATQELPIALPPGSTTYVVLEVGYTPTALTENERRELVYREREILHLVAPIARLKRDGEHWLCGALTPEAVTVRVDGEEVTRDISLMHLAAGCTVRVSPDVQRMVLDAAAGWERGGRRLKSLTTRVPASTQFRATRSPDRRR